MPAGASLLSRKFILCAVLVLLFVPNDAMAGGKGAPKGGGHGGHGGGGGEEEIIIPMGGSINLGDLLNGQGGGGGGGQSFSIPISPQMLMPPQGGGGIGFEETEEIGPDGKPHIISEHSFNPGTGKPLTAAQKKQQKMMNKEMQSMAKDMAHMFSNGDFLGPRPNQQQVAKDRKYQDDLFKNALKAFDTTQTGRPNAVHPMIDQQPQWDRVARSQTLSRRVPNGWEVKGNTDWLSNIGTFLACGIILAGVGLVGFRYYKTKVKYTPVGDDGGIEVL